jgi:hydroxysqualene synthase
MTGAHRMQGVSHYENFPVASWLCPPRLRPAIQAIYAFARTADDMADEGCVPAHQRLADLAAFEADLLAATAQHPPGSDRWPEVFGPLAPFLHGPQPLPLALLQALLSAFREDVVRTRDQTPYRTHDEVLDYCARSANPVGRLLLHLYGIEDHAALARSDAICTALQLINFWQDLSRDLPQRRHYLNLVDCTEAGLTPDLAQLTSHPDSAPASALASARALIALQTSRAVALMQSGAPLALQVPGRAGWELRLVVQGGLQIAQKIEQLHHQTWTTRPRLNAADLGIMGWRAVRMAWDNPAS